MADAPWRCSQCGTVNEPVANACRACGRWPSLFDLERSTIPADEPATYDEADEFAAQTVDLEVAQPDVYAPEPTLVEMQTGDVAMPVSIETIEADVDIDEAEQPKPLWQRLASLIVPIAVVAYIIISALVNNDAG